MTFFFIAAITEIARVI